MYKVLVVVDMQNDFTTGCLGNDACKGAIKAVEDVVRNGNRVLPWFIDEQDSRSDIYASGNISEGTLIRNVYGSRYYFYCWSNSDGSGDVFGYTGEYGYPDMSYQEIKGVL